MAIDNVRQFIKSLLSHRIDSVLDLGCGSTPICREIVCPVKLGIDLDPRGIAIAGRYIPVLPFDITNLDQLAWPPQHWGAVLAFDVLEHLTAEAAESVIREAKRISSTVVTFIPLNDPGSPEDQAYQRHRSLWDLEAVRNLMGHDTVVLPHYHGHGRDAAVSIWTVVSRLHTLFWEFCR